MANTCNTSLNSNIQQIRSDLTQGLTDNSPGLWITSIDISQVIDAQFPDLSKYLTPPVENTREIVNFTVNNTARVSSISSFHHLSSPSRESLNAQIYDSLAVPIRKLAKDVEEVLNLALPSETLELSLLQFSRECGDQSFINPSQYPHIDTSPTEYIVVTVALFAKVLTAKQVMQGHHKPINTKKGGTSYKDLNGQSQTAPTKWLFINSGQSRESFFKQNNRSATHWATPLTDRGVVIMRFKRK